MNKLIKFDYAAISKPVGDLSPFNYQVKNKFDNALIEYFSLYWKEHQWTDRDMMAPVMSPAEIQSKNLPVFHGLILFGDETIGKDVEKYIRKLFTYANMPLNDSILRKPRTIHNNSGEFTFINVATNNLELWQILHGRRYDLAIIIETPDFASTDDMINEVVPTLIVQDPARIIIFKTES